MCFLDSEGRSLIDILGDSVVEAFHCSRGDYLEIGTECCMFGAEGGCKLRELMIAVSVVVTDRLSRGDVLSVLKVHSVVVRFFGIGFGPRRAVFAGTL